MTRNRDRKCGAGNGRWLAGLVLAASAAWAAVGSNIAVKARADEGSANEPGPENAQDANQGSTEGASASQAGAIPIRFKLDKPRFVTLVVEDANGKRVRNLVQNTRFGGGEHTVWWDGYDVGETTSPRRHYHQTQRHPVTPGRYTVRGLVHDGIHQRYEFSVYSGKNDGPKAGPPWHSLDGTGAWMADHSEIYDVTYLPDGSPYGKQPQLLVSSQVVEAGYGYCWMDLNGNKLGGAKTGWDGALATAIDQGDHPWTDKYGAYALSVWGTSKKYDKPHQTLHIRAIDHHGKFHEVFKRDIRADKGARSNAKDLVVYNGKVIVGMTYLDKLYVLDAKGRKSDKILAKIDMPDPKGLAFDSRGRLLVVTGNTVKRFTVDWANLTLTNEQKLVEGLENPQMIEVGPRGAIYVSDWYPSHQVKVFSPSGKPMRTLGQPGGPQLGPYNPRRMHYPRGFAIVPADRTDAGRGGEVWVAERDFGPKRVSHWTSQGQFMDAIYGPPAYGGGGTLDPHDRSRYYYSRSDCVMRFDLNWKQGTNKPAFVPYRNYHHHGFAGPKHNEPGGPISKGVNLPGAPYRVIYAHGQKYMTNNWHMANYDNSGVVGLWKFNDKGLLEPVAAFGKLGVSNYIHDVHRADWDRLEQPDIKPMWAKLPAQRVLFTWSDLNQDQQVQPDEIKFAYDADPEEVKKWPFTIKDQFTKAGRKKISKYVGKGRWYQHTPFSGARKIGEMYLGPDLSITDSYGYHVPVKVDANGIPHYQTDRAKALAQVNKSFVPTASASQMTMPFMQDDMLVVMGQPIVGYDLRTGAERWRYPVFGAAHDAGPLPEPQFAGQIMNMKRMIGPPIHPQVGEAGTVLGVNGYFGNVFMFTNDGLYLTTLGGDIRVRPLLRANQEKRGMILDGYSLDAESFFPTLNQVTEDGKANGIYLIAGKNYSGIQTLEGFETVKRVKPFEIQVSKSMVAALPEERIVPLKLEKGQSKKNQEHGTLGLRRSPVKVDGQLSDWRGMPWLTVSEQRGMYAALATDGKMLYAAFRTGRPELLNSRRPEIKNLFLDGGCLELNLATKAGPDVKRKKRPWHSDDDRVQAPKPGDLRLLVTRGGDPKTGPVHAALYEQNVGSKSDKNNQPLLYDSPIGAVKIDQLTNVSDEVRLAQHKGDYELAIPLSALDHFQPKAGKTYLGDLGVIVGDGREATARLYWSNKVDTMTSDIPSEAELTPRHWGLLKAATVKPDANAPLPSAAEPTPASTANPTQAKAASSSASANVGNVPVLDADE